MQKQKKGKNVKYPDLLISCSKFKIILELLSNERYTHKIKEGEAPSSVLGHIIRTKNYSNFLKQNHG